MWYLKFSTKIQIMKKKNMQLNEREIENREYEIDKILLFLLKKEKGIKFIINSGEV